MASIFGDSSTPCFAWTLMTNHVHLLSRTADTPLATLMRHLLTGYAMAVNRRYHRHGQLFQNRYQSILCQEDAYLLELTRYIHLNPLRAGMVKDLDALSHAMADYVDLSSEPLYTPGRYPVVVHARRILCFLAARELGVTATELARQMGLTLNRIDDDSLLQFARGQRQNLAQCASQLKGTGYLQHLGLEIGLPPQHLIHDRLPEKRCAANIKANTPRFPAHPVRWQSSFP